MELIISIKIDGVEVKDVKVNTETEKVDEDICACQSCECSRFYGDGDVAEHKEPVFDRMSFEERVRYLNKLLEDRGYLTDTEFRYLLSSLRIKEGGVTGWKHDEDESGNCKYVDFGIFKNDSVDGYNRTIFLDFNVDNI